MSMDLKEIQAIHGFSVQARERMEALLTQATIAIQEGGGDFTHESMMQRFGREHKSQARAFIEALIQKSPEFAEMRDALQSDLYERQGLTNQAQFFVQGAARLFVQESDISIYQALKTLVTCLRQQGGPATEKYILPKEDCLHPHPLGETGCAPEDAWKDLTDIFMPNTLRDLNDDDLPAGAIRPLIRLLSKPLNAARYDGFTDENLFADALLKRYGNRCLPCLVHALQTPDHFAFKRRHVGMLRKRAYAVALSFGLKEMQQFFTLLLEAGWNESLRTLAPSRPGLAAILKYDFQGSPYGSP